MKNVSTKVNYTTGVVEANNVLTADDVNSAFTEIENVILTEGIVLDGSSTTQLNEAIDNKISSVVSVSSDPTDLSVGSHTVDTLEIQSSTGSNYTIPKVSSVLAGLMSAQDKVDLEKVKTNNVRYVDAIADLATVDVDFRDAGGVVVVMDAQGNGDSFVYTGNTNNGGITINGYTRQNNKVTPEMFGFTGTEATLLQDALDYVGANKTYLYSGIVQDYYIDSVEIKQGTLGVLLAGVIIHPQDSTKTPITYEHNLSDCHIVLELDMSNGSLIALGGNTLTYDNATTYGRAIHNSTLSIKAYGFINHATLNHFGIFLGNGSSGNDITKCNIECFDTPTQRGFGVALYGEATTAYGGFYLGSNEKSLNPCANNRIHNNVFTNGSYGVSLQFGDGNKVYNNTISNNNHRNIYLAGEWNSEVYSNTLIDGLSTSVLLGYSSVNNSIHHNTCINSVASGEAMININTGSSSNTVHNNQLDGGNNYGVYVAVDAIENKVHNNTIKNYYVAAIALENDWRDTPPTGAIFSRPNYAPPLEGTTWAHKSSTGNQFTGNTIGSPYPGRAGCAIYVSQIGSDYETSRTVFKDNIITGDIGSQIYFFEETAGMLYDTELSNTTNANANITKMSTVKRSHLLKWHGNDKLDEALNSEVVQTIGATPSVEGWSKFQLMDTTTTDLTNFEDGVNGQEIEVRLNVNTTIKYNSGLIRPKGNIDVIGNSNQYITFRRISNIWFEMARSF